MSRSSRKKDKSTTQEVLATLADKQREAIIGGLTSVLQTTDRAMVMDTTLTVETQDIAFPGQTDGKTIILGKYHLKQLFENMLLSDVVRVVNGTNYHELAHVKFTPRQGDNFVTALANLAKRVPSLSSDKLWKLWNILEDQRIETLYTTAYPNVTPYFVAAAMKWLLENTTDTQLMLSFPFICGRKFLPVELRERAKKVFSDVHGAGVADALEAIIDEYLICIPNEQTRQAVKLVERFATTLPNSSNKPSNCNSRMIIAGIVELDQNDSLLPDIIHQIDDEKQDTTLGSDVDPNSQKSIDEAKEGSDGKGVSSLSQDGDAVEQTRELLQSIMDQANSDPGLKREITETVNAVRNAASNGAGTGGHTNTAKGSMQAVTASMRNASNRVAESLRRIKDEVEPGWQRDQPTGRLNIQRVVMRQFDPTKIDIFDKWEEGHEEEAETQAVIILDTSGSMESQAQKTSESLWVLTHALKQVGISVTVYSFNVTTALLYSPNDKQSAVEFKVFVANGGTIARDAVDSAYNILMRTDAPNRLFIAITDGNWSCGGSTDKVISTMRRAGVKTVMFSLVPRELPNHNCEIYRGISDPSELVGVVNEMVSEILEDALT